ncbi:MAG: hypothetical protein L0H03_14510, partial [Rhodococcus sp. (in: high G+C Gram-positive bacteria)]|nr:hypothetical protein [Rhodococcus sp. (in: high G+C Gram-positive bacteria)]
MRFLDDDSEHALAVLASQDSADSGHEGVGARQFEDAMTDSASSDRGGELNAEGVGEESGERVSGEVSHALPPKRSVRIRVGS